MNDSTYFRTNNTLMFFRVMTENEHKYSFSQNGQLKAQCGFIGYLRGDFGKDGNHFYSTWNEENSLLKTEEFSKEFDMVVNTLRLDPAYMGFLQNLNSMKSFCKSRPNSHIEGIDDTRCYGFRVNTNKYAYLFRCIPYENDYNFYIYAYESNKLDNHLLKANKGIRFIKPDYSPLFILTDGKSIKITLTDGTQEIKRCRYINEYHTEIGNKIFHIGEFAELMEKNGSNVEPCNKKDIVQKSKQNIER